MAPEADDLAEAEGRLTLGRGLRFLEGLAFCCLAALVLLWAIDRSRSVDFDPIDVALCTDETCLAPSEDPATRPWAQYSATLDLRGLVVMSPADTCAFAATLLQTRATEAGTDQVLDHLQDRGTLSITYPEAATARLSPGPNNDGVWDIARDALRWQGARGCHPQRYVALFWPLWSVWMLLINWRILRRRQAVWASR